MPLIFFVRLHALCWNFRWHIDVSLLGGNEPAFKDAGFGGERPSGLGSERTPGIVV
jgi:hypothetical protein